MKKFMNVKEKLMVDLRINTRYMLTLHQQLRDRQYNLYNSTRISTDEYFELEQIESKMAIYYNRILLLPQSLVIYDDYMQPTITHNPNKYKWLSQRDMYRALLLLDYLIRVLES